MSGLRTLLMLALPVVLAAGILAVMSARGASVFKKQGVAWGITLLMVFAAIGIGYAKAPVNHPAPEPGYAETIPPANVPAGSASCVWDNARVLSGKTVRTLDQRNDRLWSEYQVSIGVVTCNYGRSDLDEYGRDCAVKMGLGDYDMIVMLDISGDNYWLLRGAGLERDFTDSDCSDYAYDYMEDYFVRGMYDDAVLDLTEVLEAWYGAYFG